MRILVPFATALFIAATSQSFGSGLASSSNFVVGAEQQELAEAVLAKAEAYRKQIAREWLGDELPSGGERVVIDVFLSGKQDYGLTRIDPGDSRGKHHMMWIVTSRKLIDSTLAHEMTHVVLGCRYQDRIPAWANEGAASLLDDPRRQATRRRIIAESARMGRWPDLNEILDRRGLASSDVMGYAISASVTELLLSRASKPTFLRFAIEGQSQGWDAALWRYYRIRSVRELQVQWRDWVLQRTESVSSRSPSEATTASTDKRDRSHRF